MKKKERWIIEMTNEKFLEQVENGPQYHHEATMAVL